MIAFLRGAFTLLLQYTILIDQVRVAYNIGQIKLLSILYHFNNIYTKFKKNRKILFYARGGPTEEKEYGCKVRILQVSCPVASVIAVLIEIFDEGYKCSLVI